MIDRIQINDRISYIKASTEPLSADVIIVEGDAYTYLFDVGNDEKVAEYLAALSKPKKIVLSHFHQDHMGNIGKIPFMVVYAGANTEKYFQSYIEGYAKERMQAKYQIPLEPVWIKDGVELAIYPIPNSHAKGSLVLMVNQEYLFLGDSLYSKVQENNYVYNAQLLKEEMELLKMLPAKTVFSSHEERPLKRKDGVIRFLEQIYEKRRKDDAYIRIEREI